MRFRLVSRKLYPWVFLGAFAVFAFVPSIFPALSIQHLIAVATAIVAFIHFLYKQHTEETRLFHKLFTDFNRRYDKLNDGLNTILNVPEERMLSSDEKQILYDYFNLCAEEYLFYTAGYIDQTAWDAWRNGMKIYLRTEKVRLLLHEELRSNSYYGLSLEIIDTP